MMNPAIGETYFVFDGNRRVYDKTKGYGGPIYREHFASVKIVGETKTSWIYSYYTDTKVTKKNPWKVLFTSQMVDEAVWVYENRVAIADKVRNGNYAALKQIEAILNHPEKAKS